MRKYGIKEEIQVFNLDYCGFYIRGMTLGRTKCVVQTGIRGYKREMCFRGTYDHLTMIEVISESDQVMKPLFATP